MTDQEGMTMLTRVNMADGGFVEVDVRAGLPSFTIRDIGDGVQREVREVVRAALLNRGWDAFPLARITVNLSGSAREIADERQIAYLVALGVLAISERRDVTNVVCAVPRLMLDGANLPAPTEEVS